MTALAVGTVRFAAALLPKHMRERHREQWLADLADAESVGISRGQIAVGSLAFAVTYDRPLRVRLVTPETVARRSRLAAGLALSAALVALSAYASVVSFGGLTGIEWFDLTVFLMIALGILYTALAPIAAVVLVTATRGVAPRIRLAVWLLTAACLAPVAHMAIDAPNQSIGDIYTTPGAAAYVVAMILIVIASAQMWREFASHGVVPASRALVVVGGALVLALAAAGLVASAALWIGRPPLEPGADIAWSKTFTAEWFALEAAAEQRVLATWIGVAVGALLLAGLVVAVGLSKQISAGTSLAIMMAASFTVLIAFAAYFSFLELMLSMLESTELVTILLLVGRWGIALTVAFAVSGLRLTRRAWPIQADRGVRAP